MQSFKLLFLMFFGMCSILPVKAFMIAVTDSDDIDQIFSEYQYGEQPITHIDYQADAFLSRDEFHYLTELCPGKIITEAILKKACLYLFAKKKFKKIIVTLEESHEGLRIFFDMTAYWTFNKLVVSGILFGKEQYASLYGMESGEIFEELKHNHGVSKILELLKSDGYCHAKIRSFFEYDEMLKTVTVKMHIIRGERFKFGGIDIKILADDELHDKIVVLENTLRARFLNGLKNSYYQKNKLERLTHLMSIYLEQEGYAQSTIALQEKIDRDTKKVVLLYTISVGSYRQFVFFGNAFFPNKKLLECIMQLGKSAWLVPSSILAQEIVQLYKNRGFLKVTVDTREEKNKCIFLIKEGSRQAVSLIEIQNCFSYDSAYLVNNFFKQTTKNKYFDYDTFQQDRNNLCDFYIKNGYLDIQILEHKFIDLSSKKSLLILSLDEGKRYKVKAISIKDHADLSNELWKDHQGVYLTNDFIVMQREKIQSLCRERYFQDYNACPEIRKIDDESIAIEWTVRLASAPKKFGKTIIIGSIDLPFKNIIRENAFTADQQWNNDLLRETFTRLKSVNIFDSIFLSSQKLGTQKIYNDEYVAARLHCDDPYEVQVRTGLELKNATYKRFFGDGVGYKVGGSFIMKNPLKRCDSMRCDIDIARFHYEVGFEYRYPWMFNTLLRGMAKVYATKHDQPAFVGNEESVYTVYHNGLLGSLQKTIGPFDLNINLGFDWGKTVAKDDCNTIECFFQFARAINFRPSLLDVYIPYFFVEPTFYMDRLDDKIDPRRGGLTIASVKSMIPLSNIHKPSYFVKFLIEQSFFWSYKDCVGAFRLRFGHIFHKDFSRVMPTQRFYLGGSQSLRGYLRDMAPPLGVYVNSEHQKVVVPQGAKSMVNINMEVRIPLPQKWGMVIFQDFGTLGNEVKAHFNADNILTTTGLGIRYKTPVGPLRLDVGWKWFRQHQFEKSFGWYLAIGNAF